MTSHTFPVRLPTAALVTLNRLARKRGATESAVIREALGILDVTERREPGEYVGTTADREALTTVIRGAR